MSRSGTCTDCNTLTLRSFAPGELSEYPDTHVVVEIAPHTPECPADASGHYNESWTED